MKYFFAFIYEHVSVFKTTIQANKTNTQHKEHDIQIDKWRKKQETYGYINQYIVRQYVIQNLFQQKNNKIILFILNKWKKLSD